MPLSSKPALQHLWEVARPVLGQPGRPTDDRMADLQQSLSEVPLSELGFRKAAPPASAAAANGGRANITYLHIHEDEELSLGIFCLPAGSVIPLHNHPGMTVLSRVLYGRMHVTSYDWEDPAAEGQPCPRAAAPVLDRVCGPGDAPVVLYPSSGGNIHRFAAETDCAVLDLLSPPYSPDDGRDCTYYREADDNPARAPGQPVMLAQYEPPASFVIQSGKYKGQSVHTPKHDAPTMTPSSLHGDDDSGSTGNNGGKNSPRSVAGDGSEDGSAGLAKRMRNTNLDEPGSPTSGSPGGSPARQ